MSRPRTPLPTPDLLDLDAAAKRLGVEVRMMRRLQSERRIPYIKVGRWVRFDPRDLDDYIAAQRVNAMR